MEMVKVLLSDGSIVEKTREEFDALSIGEMHKEFGGRLIVDVKFFNK